MRTRSAQRPLNWTRSISAVGDWTGRTAVRPGAIPTARNGTVGAPEELPAFRVRPDSVNGKRFCTLKVVRLEVFFVTFTETHAEATARSMARARPGPSMTEAAEPSVNPVLASGDQS